MFFPKVIELKISDFQNFFFCESFESQTSVRKCSEIFRELSGDIAEGK
jgi:hypothetical protein